MLRKILLTLRYILCLQPPGQVTSSLLKVVYMLHFLAHQCINLTFTGITCIFIQNNNAMSFSMKVVLCVNLVSLMFTTLYSMWLLLTKSSLIRNLYQNIRRVETWSSLWVSSKGPNRKLTYTQLYLTSLWIMFFTKTLFHVLPVYKNRIEKLPLLMAYEFQSFKLSVMVMDVCLLIARITKEQESFNQFTDGQLVLLSSLRKQKRICSTLVDCIQGVQDCYGGVVAGFVMLKTATTLTCILDLMYQLQGPEVEFIVANVLWLIGSSVSMLYYEKCDYTCSLFLWITFKEHTLSTVDLHKLLFICKTNLQQNTLQ